MTSKKEESNILKFRKQRQLNIGIVIFGIIFIYLVATVFMYITAPKITVYEVRQGSILKDNAYTGLVIRDEHVVNAEGNGYINYYAQDTSKVKVGSKIYILSDKEMNFDTVSDETVVDMTKDMEKKLILEVQKFNKNFEEEVFDETYSLKYNLENKLKNLSSDSKTNQINQLVNQSTSGVSVYQTSEDGIVGFTVDGMESLTEESVTLDDLDKTEYQKTQYTSNSKIQKGNPVFKIITSDEWSMAIELSKENAEILADKKYVKVNITKDNQQIWASFRMEERDGHTIAFLSFQDSMVRYANDRYLEFELILEDETGLKIPKTAETTKEFFVIPKMYITQGGNSSKDGILVQATNEQGNKITEFKDVTIYYEEDELVYLEPNEFEVGTVVLMPDSNDTYILSGKKELTGVYCINKGYAVFKQIHILCESDSYYIVEEGNAYGLSNYDHIALDSTGIKENDVVF